MLLWCCVSNVTIQYGNDYRDDDNDDDDDNYDDDYNDNNTDDNIADQENDDDKDDDDDNDYISKRNEINFFTVIKMIGRNPLFHFLTFLYIKLLLNTIYVLSLTQLDYVSIIRKRKSK